MVDARSSIQYRVLVQFRVVVALLERDETPLVEATLRYATLPSKLELEPPHLPPAPALYLIS